MIQGHEKGEVLLNILIDTNEKLLQNNDTQQMQRFKKIGETKMKQAAAKYS